MRHLNYTHLFYFWNVAREGSIAKASEVLNLTPQTISGQLKLLEEFVGEALFERVGRGLALTDTGQVVRDYADEIFLMGAELTERIRSNDGLLSARLNVGVVDSTPKLVALRVLEPVFSLPEDIRVVIHEGDFDSLMASLSIHKIDLVVSNRSVPRQSDIKAYSHTLGESAIGFFAHESIAEQYREDFPACLDGAPMLLPLSGSPLRRQLDEWFVAQEVRPLVRAEFDDSALLKAFGQAALGIFPAPLAISGEVREMYRAQPLGEAAVAERYHVITTERKIRHPVVLSLTEHSKRTLFS